MRRPTSLLAAVSVTAVLLPGCASVDETVDQAQDAVSEGLRRLEWCTAAFRLGQAVEARDVEAARAAADDMADNAPEELEDEVATVMQAIEAAEGGDLEQIQSEEVRTAGEQIIASAEQQCDPTTRPE